MSTGAWGQVTWGYAKWGELGDATTSLNNTNLLATTTLGTGTQEGEINSGWGRADGWATFGWGIQGTLQASGIQATAALSSVTATAEINTGWGSDTWGTELWGSSGIQATAALSTVIKPLPAEPADISTKIDTSLDPTSAQVSASVIVPADPNLITLAAVPNANAENSSLEVLLVPTLKF